MSIWDDQILAMHENALANIYIDRMDQGMKLISKLLKENNQQTELRDEFDQFSKLVDTEFLQILERMAYPANASLYHELILFQKKIEELIMFPELYRKKVIAVGGGFSAGKSKLINLMIGSDLLPTDTTPTTSIPSYIMHGRDTLYCAHNIYGLKSELDEEAIKAITHAFSEKYQVNLAQMLKNILIKSASMPYENIAILDTPGYSKSDHHKHELNKDEHMARVNLTTADCLIWVVDIEKGTVPVKDFEFIKSMEIDCPIFFVFNKADMKERSDIDKIIHVARENIHNQGINCAGIGAISALLQKEYGDELLFDFLKEQNEYKGTYDLKEQFLSIFKKHEQHSAKTILEIRNELKVLNEIALISTSRDAQDLARSLIAEKKKRITQERDRVKQFNQDLSPFLTSIDKIEALLQNLDHDPETNRIIASRRQFLQRLLKVNLDPFIEDKISFLLGEISLAGMDQDGMYSPAVIADGFDQALSLLQEDINIKIQKEMTRVFSEMKSQILERSISEMEKNEILSLFAGIIVKVSDNLDLIDTRFQKLSDVIRDYDSFSKEYEEALIGMLSHDSRTIGNRMKETISLIYQDTITAMLDEEGHE